MSKRTRGSTRPHRPGTRPPISRPAGVRPIRRGQVDSSAGEIPAAGEATPAVRADSVEGRVADVAEPQRAARGTSVAHARVRAKPGSVLATRAANEYVYVAQDIRRIVVIGGLLVAAMILAWLLIVVLKVIPVAYY